MNNLGGNVKHVKFNFLVQGIYHILSIESNLLSEYSSYPAKVRRLSNGFWINETVDLAYLFRGSKTPFYSPQREALIGQKIEIKDVIRQQTDSGKTYYEYNWGIAETSVSESLDNHSQNERFDEINNKLASRRQKTELLAQEESCLELGAQMTTEQMNRLNSRAGSHKQKAGFAFQEESFCEFGGEIDSEELDSFNNRIALLRQKNK